MEKVTGFATTSAPSRNSPWFFSWGFGSPPGLLLALALLGLYLTGLIGMFDCRKHAPYVFLGSVVFAAALFPYSLGYVRPWESMLDMLGATFSGVLFALAAYGPAKHLFRDRHAGTRRPGAVEESLL